MFWVISLFQKIPMSLQKVAKLLKNSPNLVTLIIIILHNHNHKHTVMLSVIMSLVVILSTIMLRALMLGSQCFLLLY
jgi:hypothetical protein